MSSQPENTRLTAESRIQPSTSVVWRRVEGSIILVDLGTNKTYELNRTGGRLWELLDGGSSYGDALATLGAEFEVGHEELRAEASKLISLLLQERLAEEAQPS
jgi:Coenzyme PQQ synthesis protein D (PqqD)